MSDKPTHNHLGQCHCGAVKVSLETAHDPDRIKVRACQCSYCRRNGAKNVTDASGQLTIDARADDIHRYRFGLKTADFLCCAQCGAYVAAVIGAGEDKRATVNVTGAFMEPFASRPPDPVFYDDEEAEDRRRRRFERWTPVRFTAPELNESLFGEGAPV